jgi:hypothetical protein
VSNGLSGINTFISGVGMQATDSLEPIPSVLQESLVD